MCPLIVKRIIHLSIKACKLIIHMDDSAGLLKREIRCWSVLRFKGWPIAHMLDVFLIEKDCAWYVQWIRHSVHCAWYVQWIRHSVQEIIKNLVTKYVVHFPANLITSKMRDLLKKSCLHVVYKPIQWFLESGDQLFTYMYVKEMRI